MTTDLAELDRMLAEFMGTYKCSCGSPNCQNVWLQHPANCLLTNWHPTTGIAQAFMVAEKVGELRVEQRPVGYWWVRFAGTMEYQEADTPTLAICLAAKAWLEGRKEGDAQ